jgi:hypothetical protein
MTHKAHLYCFHHVLCNLVCSFLFPCAGGDTLTWLPSEPTCVAALYEGVSHGYEPKLYNPTPRPLRLIKGSFVFFVSTNTKNNVDTPTPSIAPTTHLGPHFLKPEKRMADAEEIQYNNDCLVITINIVDCPMTEIPLTEVFNITTMSFLDNYHNVICDTVLQQLEDTTWLSEDQLPTLTDPGFGMYHARNRNSVISLIKACTPATEYPASQRSSASIQLGSYPRPDTLSYPQRRYSKATKFFCCIQQRAQKSIPSFPLFPSRSAFCDRHVRPS